MKSFACAKFLIICALVFVAISISGQDQDTDLLQKGKSLFKQSKWAEACLEFEEYLDKNPESDEAWYGIGLCKIKLGDGNGARKALHRISDENMKYKERLGKYLKATATERLTKQSLHLGGSRSANKSNYLTKEYQQDDPICQANRKVIAGALVMYSMDNRSGGTLPDNIFDRLIRKSLLPRPPECPKEGVFSIYQQSSTARVVCSVHGYDDESNAMLSTHIVTSDEIFVAEKTGIKPLLKVPEGSLKKMPFTELEELAEGGAVDAQVEIALRYRGGRRGVEKDLQKARSWLEKASSQGNAMAMTELGLFLWSDERDLAKSWLEKAAVEENRASFFLGNIHNIEYLSNRSLQHEQEKARQWYAVGADRGHPPSVVNLFKINFSGSLFEVTSQDVEPLRKAAMAGYPPAMKKYAEAVGILGELQNDEDKKVECWAWNIIYEKLETDVFEQEKAGKFVEMMRNVTAKEIQSAGEDLAAKLEPQIQKYEED